MSSAVGHPLESGTPEAQEVKRGKWTFAHLLAIPSDFELKPIDESGERLKRKDIASTANACGAGREDELIFRHLVTCARTDQPIRRKRA